LVSVITVSRWGGNEPPVTEHESGRLSAAELLNTLAVEGQYGHIKVINRTTNPARFWVLAEQEGSPINKTISVHYTPTVISTDQHRLEWESFLNQLVDLGAHLYKDQAKEATPLAVSGAD